MEILPGAAAARAHKAAFSLLGAARLNISYLPDWKGLGMQCRRAQRIGAKSSDSVLRTPTGGGADLGAALYSFVLVARVVRVAVTTQRGIL